MKLLSEDFLAKYRNQTPKSAGVLFYPIYLRTYSRWLEGKQRRERWDETVERVVEYSFRLYEGPNKDHQGEAESLYDSIFNLKVLPAGRTLWIGGTPAAERCGEVNFNCSFRVIDGLEAFTDLFHLLLCGCGVGFRVLEADVAQLPSFKQAKLTIEPYSSEPVGYRSEHTKWVEDFGTKHIHVGDSREGWVKALAEFLYSSVVGHEVYMNFNSVRPAGERIKGFGGHAPGPEGLMEMFRNVNRTINASGGRLSPVDCMDICNYIGKNVIVGGTRRSSQIALGSPRDQSFIDAKKGLWETKTNLQRTMSNNSVVFEEDPTFEQVQSIFEGIKNNGEPGFSNLKAMRKTRPNCEGANPCLPADTWVNTAEGPRMIKDLLQSTFMAKVHSEYRSATPFWSTGIKDVYSLKTKEGYSVKLTNNHQVLTEEGWKEAKDLLRGDKIVLGNSSAFKDSWEGAGNFEEGWMLGSMVGDGTYNSTTQASMRFWGETREVMAEMAYSFMDNNLAFRADTCVTESKANKYLQVGCTGLASLAAEFGLVRGNKVFISEQIEKASSEFYRGFLSGIFDADGSVQGNTAKGRSIRLSQSNPKFLEGVQRMLLRLGIKSTVYTGRTEAAFRPMPDGQGGLKDYFCQAMNELVVSRSSMRLFHERVGFKEPKKAERLASYFTSQKRGTYQDKFVASFESLDLVGQEEVYDCTVEDLHRFEANGLIVHNCHEINLDNRGFCNLCTVNLTAFVVDGVFNLYGALDAITHATRMGLRMTNVTVSLPKWDVIQKRDRLLGVSLTGIVDAFDSLGVDSTSPEALTILALLEKEANKVAREYAFEMRVPVPLLVTTIKPEGTISQLPTVSSGLHRSYAPYFIRRVRYSAMDPACQALQRLGVPNEPDQGKAERVVFSFPIKTATKISANEEPARDQFKRYLSYMENYVNHNASCTLTIGEGEWEEMEKLVFDNFDRVIACAFLPKYTDAFPQMPYEEITKEQYEKLAAEFPNLDTLPELVNQIEVGEFESELEEDPSCAGGVCPTR